MTKKQYISALRSRLRFRMSPSEINDILSDMNECFDAGAAEGKSEEEIAEKLGSPKSAAEELIAQRPHSADNAAKLGEYILPSAVSIAAAFLLICFAAFGKAPVFIWYLVPPFIWLIMTGTGFFKELCGQKSGILTFIGAVMIFAAASVFRSFTVCVIGKEKAASTAAVMMSLFICVSMGILAAVFFKKERKLLCLLPVAAIISAIHRAAGFLYFFSYSPEHSDSLYIRHAARYNQRYLYLLMICAAAYLLLIILQKSGFSLPSMYAVFFAALLLVYLRRTLMYIDPETPFPTIKYLIKGEEYITGGAISAAVSILIVIAARLVSKQKDGES